MYHFLKKDLQGLTGLLAQLGDDLRRVNADAAEWASQSSETWHDNFGFEEGERQKRALMVRMDEVRKVQKSAQIAQRPQGDTVEVGSIVRIVNEAGVQREFAVSSYMVFEKRLETEVSYEAPVVKPLLGASVGDEVEIRLGRGGVQTVEIVAISVDELLFS